MKTYTLDQSQLEKEKKSIIMMYGITMIVLIVLAVSINFGRDTMQSLVWLIPLMAAMYVFMGIRSYRQRKDFYEGYSLQITEDALIQNQPRMRELKFLLSDITTVDDQKRGIVVSIKQARNVLGISKDTMFPADFEELKATLMGWASKNSSDETPIPAQLNDSEVEEGLKAPEQPADEVEEPAEDTAQD